jgi:hypothetical protein
LPVSDKRELKNNFYMHKENLKWKIWWNVFFYGVKYE